MNHRRPKREILRGTDSGEVDPQTDSVIIILSQSTGAMLLTGLNVLCDELDFMLWPRDYL